jgi:serine/threonine protein kinase
VQRARARTMTGARRGTPAYMAQERLVPGARVDGRADTYAAGVMLAEMVLGRHRSLMPPESSPSRSKPWCGAAWSPIRSAGLRRPES